MEIKNEKNKKCCKNNSLVNDEKNINISYENISEKDINIINKYIIHNNFWKNKETNISPFNNKNFKNLIFKKTNFIKDIEASKETELQNINIHHNFINKRVYMSPIEYFYYIKPNAIQGKLNYYIKKINNESSIGVEYVQRRSKRAFFIQNVSYLSNNNEFLMKYNYAKREDDFKRKSNIYSTKIKLT